MFQTVVFREFNNFSSLLLPLYQLVSNVFLQKNSEKVQIYKHLWQNCCIRTIFSWIYIKQDRIIFYLCLTQSYFFQKQICRDFVNNLLILRSWFSTNCEILVRNSIFFREALVTFILLILTLVMIWCQIRENGERLNSYWEKWRHYTDACCVSLLSCEFLELILRY